MDRKALEAQILELVSTSYNKPLASLNIDMSIKDDLGGASVLMVSLVSQIENELDVVLQLPVAAKCRYIRDIVDRVEELL